MTSSPITSCQIDGEAMEIVRDFIFLGSKIIANGDCSHEIKRCLLLGRKSMTNLESKDITLPAKVRLVKAMVFPVVMYGYESWTIKKAEHWRIDAFELWCWSQYHSPKGNQPWTFIGRTDAEAEAPILWACDAKSRLIGKDPGAGKDWRREEKMVTEDELVGWHHWLNEFEEALGDSEGQGSLECCSPWGHKESDTTYRLNNNLKFTLLFCISFIAESCSTFAAQ